MAEDKMVGWHYQLNGHEFGKLRQLLIVVMIIGDYSIICLKFSCRSHTQELL